MRVVDLVCGDSTPSAVIAITGGQAMDLKQFRADVAINAGAIRALGCRRGLLLTRDSYWAAVGMLALFQADATVVMPQNALPRTFSDLAAEWDHLICDETPNGISNALVLRHGLGSDGPLVARDPEQDRIELFTSGSTGTPKRVIKDLACMEREAATLEAQFGRHVRLDSLFTGTVSHQHLYGLSFRLFWPLCNGRRFDGTVHEFWESLCDAPAGGAIITSPAHLQRVTGLAPFDIDHQPSLIVSAGAPLPATAAAEARACFGAPIVEIYGSTETNSIAWRDGADPVARWKPLPEVVVGQTGDGRLLLRSPFLSDRGAHETSDLINLYADGTFELSGRADRIAKIEGKRISLPDVEQRLAALPEVEAAATVVLPGDKPCLAAAIVASREGAKDLSALGAFRFGRKLRRKLAQSIEPAGLPRRWRFVEALPTGVLGKLRAEDVMALFQDPPREPDLRAMRTGENWVEVDLFNRPDLVQLEGHFPALAIVPGVAQVDWAVKMAARHLHLPITTANRLKVKFHRLTLPNTQVTLRLEHDPAHGRLHFTYLRPDEQVLTSGTIGLEVS